MSAIGGTRVPARGLFATMWHATATGAMIAPVRWLSRGRRPRARVSASLPVARAVPSVSTSRLPGRADGVRGTTPSASVARGDAEVQPLGRPRRRPRRRGRAGSHRSAGRILLGRRAGQPQDRRGRARARAARDGRRAPTSPTTTTTTRCTSPPRTATRSTGKDRARRGCGGPRAWGTAPCRGSRARSGRSSRSWESCGQFGLSIRIMFLDFSTLDFGNLGAAIDAAALEALAGLAEGALVSTVVAPMVAALTADSSSSTWRFLTPRRGGKPAAGPRAGHREDRGGQGTEAQGDEGEPQHLAYAQLKKATFSACEARPRHRRSPRRRGRDHRRRSSSDWRSGSPRSPCPAGSARSWASSRPSWADPGRGAGR